jgi:prepilin signal peptidase PulO-like enzyme (type II secretory pathway)
MIREVKPENLIVGDWLVKEVRIGSKKIVPSWEGLSEKDILLLKKNKKKVLVRFGIPYVPVFFFSFLAWLVWYFLF